MNKIASTLLCVAIGASLSALGIVNSVRIQSDPVLSAQDRSDAILHYGTIPLAVGAVLFFLGPMLFGTCIDLFEEWGKARRPSPPPEGIVKPPPPPPPPPPPKRDYLVESGTVIRLDEPNISLSVRLTGDAAKDAEGRQKIGAVMEHYGSGKGAARPAETVGTGPVTSEVLRALDKGGAV